MHTLTISAKFAPFDLKAGSGDTAAERFAERILDVLEQYAPNIRKAIVARQFRTPLDIARQYGLTRGAVLHGASLPHQLFSSRPFPRCSSSPSPVRSLH